MESSFQSKNFPTTLWTVVLHAGRDEPAHAQAALAQRCKGYWYPLYSFVWHRGYSPRDAEDLTQAFFAQLLDKRGLGVVDPEQGRFRTFLLASLKNFLANEWECGRAASRFFSNLLALVPTPERGNEARWQPRRRVGAG